MNIQRKNSAHHFRMQSENEQTGRRALPLPFADQTTNRIVADWERMCEEPRGSPLVCWYNGLCSSS